MRDLIQEMEMEQSAGQGYIIFSVANPDAFRKWFDLNYGDNLGIKEVRGVYKGERERSFLMNNNVFASQPAIHKYLVGQETVVFLSPVKEGYRMAAIIPVGIDGGLSLYRDEWKIGPWIQIGSEKAKVVDHTYDPAYGTYWTIDFEAYAAEQKKVIGHA